MLLSFIFDIPIFLPALGAVLFWITGRRAPQNRKKFVWALGSFTLAMFWLISGSIYFDVWFKGGNHFMWYSWLDTIGIIKSRPIPTPTYENPFGFWNLFGILLFLTYPFFLIVPGKIVLRFLSWTKGIFFGHIQGQTGLWGLLTNR